MMDVYHDALIYPGTTGMIATIGQYFTWPGWTMTIKRLARECDKCQRYKLTAGKCYGKLVRDNHPRNAHLNDVQMDLICLWSVDIKYPDNSTRPHSTTALTCIRGVVSNKCPDF